MTLLQYGFDSPPFGTVLMSFAAAFLSLFLSHRPPSARRTGARTVAVALLAVLSVLMDGPLLLTGALLVFAAGDAFLVQDDLTAARIGLSLLAAGHLLYAVLVFPAVNGVLFLSEPVRILPAVALPAVAFWWLRGTGRVGDAGLRVPAAAYALLAAAAAVLMLATPLVALATGAVLLALAALPAAILVGRSAPTAPWPLAFWLLFYTGHLLVALSALALL